MWNTPNLWQAPIQTTDPVQNWHGSTPPVISIRWRPPARAGTISLSLAAHWEIPDAIPFTGLATGCGTLVSTKMARLWATDSSISSVPRDTTYSTILRKMALIMELLTAPLA